MKKFCVGLIKFAAILVLLVLVSKGIDVCAAAFERQVAVMKKRFLVTPQTPPTLDTLIENAAEHLEIDPLILKVIADKESAFGKQAQLYRFEPELYSKFRNAPQFRGRSDSEVRMLASSHGSFHILGATAERECNMHFSRLYDNGMAALCAAKIVRRISDGLKGKALSSKLKETFRQYNGSGARAEIYAADAMVRLASLLYEQRA